MTSAFTVHWRGLLTAFTAGAVVVPAFAPFHLWPLAVVSLTALFALWRLAPTPRAAALRGFAWGMGCFLCGVSWLFVSLHDFGNMPAWMAAAAVTAFCAYLALFPALAGWLQAKFATGAAMRLLVAMPALFVAAEMTRAWFITGFPWLVVGYTQTPSWLGAAPLQGYAPLLGVFGLSWLIAIAAGGAVLLVPRWSGYVHAAGRRWLTVGAIAAVVLAGPLLDRISWSQSLGEPLAVSLLQGNVPQHLKWREDQRAATIDNYLELTDSAKGRLVVLPETAIPMMLHDVPSTVLSVMQHGVAARNGDLVLGLAYVGAAGEGDFRYYNGAIALGAGPVQRYAKRHLVAFGEFVPPLFSWVYRWLTIPLSGFTAGDTGQTPMTLAGHAVAVNICYEDAFGAEIARGAQGAALLVNLSNMAWYGRSLAAAQHAQFSQMRAIENARWVLRATNTGLTAGIDEKGRIVAALPQFTRGVLEIDAVPRRGETPYARWRDAPMSLLLALLLVACWRVRRD